jgi:hypothetical protein
MGSIKNWLYYRYSRTLEEFTNVGFLTNTCLAYHVNNNNNNNNENRIFQLWDGVPTIKLDYNDLILNILMKLQNYKEGDYGRVSSNIYNNNAKSVYEFIIRPLFLLTTNNNDANKVYDSFWQNYQSIYKYWKDNPEFPDKLNKYLTTIITDTTNKANEISKDGANLTVKQRNDQIRPVYVEAMKKFAYGFLPWYYETQIKPSPDNNFWNFKTDYINNLDAYYKKKATSLYPDILLSDSSQRLSRTA